MHISSKGRYALRAMVDLALHAGTPATRQEIASRQDISVNYLAQLFRPLQRAELVKAIRGPGGGYVLARDAAMICVGDILRAAEGPLTLSECVPPGNSPCPRAPGCRVRPLWEGLTAYVTRILDNTSLADLCNSEPIRMTEEAHFDNTTEPKGANQ